MNTDQSRAIPSTAATHDFPALFTALTGHAPFRWQTRLFEQLVTDLVPRACDIPTGLGKTSVIAIWLCALAHLADSAAEGDARTIPLPRRLVYIVDRRTVVDQATSVVERMRARLMDPASPDWGGHEPVLQWIATRLRGLAAFPGDPLAVSTLRGELADNREWKADPARPAVIIGTIDMVGSKLLFSGYGDGRYQRPHHAGLLGQDTLIVHDEAHLTPAFERLLRTIEDIQSRDGSPRPIRVLSMSATLHPDAPKTGKAMLTLEDEDESDPIVTERIRAGKKLYLHESAPKEDLPGRLADLALQHRDSAAKVLAYVTSPARDAGGDS
jgi:CRISPR-associated endonuclease/helicase Cas3